MANSNQIGGNISSTTKELSGSDRVCQLADLSDDALKRGDLDGYIDACTELGMMPGPIPLLQFAEQALLQGKLHESLCAFMLLDEEPETYYMEECAKAAEHQGDASTAKRATFLACELAKRQ